MISVCVQKSYLCSRIKFEKSMTTVTLSYDQNNAAISLLVQALRELGVKFQDSATDTTDKPTAAAMETAQAIEEMRRGDTVKFNSFDDFKKAMYEL